MNGRTDLFELQEPHQLFKEVQQAMAEYCEEPNSRLLLFLLFGLNHLREWIASNGYEALEQRRNSGHALSPGEQLFFELWALPEFKTVNALCNRSKHFRVTKSAATAVSRGMTCESPCDDSLDQLYYLIDGVDSRGIFYTVIRVYHDYFQTHRSTSKPVPADAALESGDHGGINERNHSS